VPPPRRSLELTVPGESWVHPLPGTVTGATCADTAGRSATGVLARQSQGTSATGREAGLPTRARPSGSPQGMQPQETGVTVTGVVTSAWW